MPPPRSAEQRLIQEFLAGSPPALDRFDAWIDAAVRARLPVSLRSDRDDLKQEVRTRLFHRLAQGGFDHRAALRTFIDRIARNAVVDGMRAGAKRRNIANTLRAARQRPAPRNAAHTRISKVDLMGLLQRQSQEVRRTLEMVLLGDVPYSEAARRLGVPEGTVKSRVARFRSRLGATRRLEPTA